MNRLFTGRLWIIVVITACAIVCPASGENISDWSNTYSDNFETNKVENDSYYHSIFWPQNAYPPSEPYLFYKDDGGNTALGFGDYNNEEWANLIYRLPEEQKQMTISGQFQVYVVNLTNSGKLRYSLSKDGKNWSEPIDLVSGKINNIEIKSIRGICYIKFSGYDVMIDDFKVDLLSTIADYFVDPNESYPFSNIQDTIDYAIYQSGSEGPFVIEVAPGTYSGPGNQDIDFRGEEITLYSKNGSEYTTIECQEGHRGFYFHSNEDSNSVIRGFTIKNGKKTGSNIPDETDSWSKNSSYPIGAGIYCEFSSPSIIDCIVEDCSTKYGGGIGIVGSSPYIADCVIQNCSNIETLTTSGYGGGIATIDSDAVIVNTIINNNTGYNNSYGGGIYCSQSKVLLANCEIRNNTRSSSGSLTGGGLYAVGAYSEIELQNCVIADNNAQSGAGIYSDSETVQYINDAYGQVAIACILRLTNCTIANNIGDGIYSEKSDVFIRNSIIWGNSGQNVFIDDSFYEGIILYSDIQGGYSGQGNINSNPLFASASGDYHLKSSVGRFNPNSGNWVQDDVNSPCIDAGTPGDTVEHEPCPNGKRINMGAYGDTEQASKNYSPVIIHVATSTTTGSNYHSGTSREDAYAKIQDAVNNAHSGDYILIWPGIYYEDVYVTGKGLTIQSADEPAEVRAANGYAFSFFFAESYVSILRNIIITNCSAGAIFTSSASPQLINLTIAYNTFGVDIFGGSRPIITNCIFWNNNDNNGDVDYEYIDFVTYSRIENARTNSTNIVADPEFFIDDRDNGNYHLKSTNGRYYNGIWKYDSIDSPCIDTGDGEPKREPSQSNGGKINMGAYGGTPFASKSS